MSKIVSLSRISIVNASFYAYHGVGTEERELGGRYEVDLDVQYDSTQAVLSDDVNKAVNYEELMFCVDEIISGEPCNLVETLCYEILTMVLDKFALVQEATVRVRKVSAPIRHLSDGVECEQTMQRSTPR